MGDYARKAFQRGWVPSADAVNGPNDGVLRADNLVLDEQGIISLRKGSTKINASPLADLNVNSLHTFFRGLTRYRMAGVDSHLYVNGVVQSPTYDGAGDIALHSMLGYGFTARGTTKKKTDGTTVTNWGPTPPLVAPTMAGVAASSKSIATCSQTESPAWVKQNGRITTTFPLGEDGVANGAIEVTPDGGGRVEITKTFTANTDYSLLLGTANVPEDEADLFDMGVWIEKPDEIDYCTVMIGVSGGTNPFLDHYFFDFRFGPTRTSVVTVKDKGGVLLKVTRVVGVADPIQGPVQKQAKVIEAKISKQQQQANKVLARERKDSASTDFIWGHYTVTRAQFNRVGSTEGRGWNTVTAVKLIYKTKLPGQGGKIRFDNLKMISSAFSLTGQYRFHYRYAKVYDSFQEVSAPSPSSPYLNLFGQPVTGTIPASELAQMDPQCNQIWWYIEGGFLDRPYRCFVSDLVTPAGAKQGPMPWYGLPVFGWNPIPPPTPFPVSDQKRMISLGFGYPEFTSANLTALLNVNEVDILIENETGDADQRPPDNVIAIVGPFYTRLVCLVKDPTTGQGYLYFSRQGKPGSFFPYHVLKIGDLTDIPYWVELTIGGLYVGTSKDIYVVLGQGDETEDGTIDLSLSRLNIQSPPVSEAVCVEGNAIVYRASDGWRLFNGAEANPVPNADVELLYRGFTRHGVSPVTTTGRSRAALWSGMLTTFVDETGTQAVHRYSWPRQRWYRHTYPATMLSLHREPDGTIVFGDNAGTVWQMDSGTQDDATKIPVVLWTMVDDDGHPYNRKDGTDLMYRLDTGADTAAIALHLDGSAVAAQTVSAASNGMGVWKDKINSLTPFRQLQCRITGSFAAFKLYDSSTSYRLRPRHRMFADSGYVRTGREDAVWCKEIRIGAHAAGNLTCKVYADDVLVNTQTVTVTPNVNTVYRVGMPRGVQGQTFRVTLEVAASGAATEIGVEVYWMEFRLDPTGNVTDKAVIRVSPDEVLGQ